MERILHQQRSPDGAFTLFCIQDMRSFTVGLVTQVSADAPVVFEAHRHFDLSDRDKMWEFISDIVGDRVLIRNSDPPKVGGFSFTFAPEIDLGAKPEDEHYLFRFWSGKDSFRDEEILQAKIAWIAM